LGRNKIQPRPVTKKRRKPNRIKYQITTRLNELATAMNQISKTETDKEALLLEIILAKNGIVIAKLNIVSPSILDETAISEFRDRQPTISLIELLELSSISVFQNSENLHFLIKFSNPKIKCKKITIFPVQHKKKILNFEDRNLVAECRSRNINIGHCKTTVGATFCKELQNGTCAQQIIFGAFARCSILPGHLDSVTIVDHGTLIVNDANVTITVSQGKDQKMSGTYLVTYTEKVALNGTWYINQLGNSDKKPVDVVNVTTHPRTKSEEPSPHRDS